MAKLEAIGINIYGGGFTLGAQERFKVLGQWEEIGLGRETWDLNFGQRRIPRPLKREEWPVKEFKGVPFVYANPPCAPWSSANTRAGYTKEKRFLDQRLVLTQHTMETAMRLKPVVFISESVENAYNIGQSHYDRYVNLWLKAGYAVTYFLTDAILHGLPSTRRRFHFIAHKVDLQLKPPSLVSFQPVTVRDTIADLWPLYGCSDEQLARHGITQHGYNLKGSIHRRYTKVEVMRATPPGGRCCAVEKEMFGKQYSSFLVKRLMWDAPAFTMVGLSMLIHPSGERFITWREGMRLMSFPDSFVAAKEVEAADNVTPLMGRYLSGIADRAIRRNQKVKAEFHVVDWRPLGRPYHIGVLKHKEGLV